LEKSIFNASETSLPSDHIQSVALSSTGSTFIGTYDVVLARFDGSDFVDIEVPEGISNANTRKLYDIEVADNGDLWVATSQGVFRKQGDSWTRYAEPELGDLFFEVWDIEIDQSGNVYAGAQNGVLKFENGSWTNISEGTSLQPYLDSELYFSQNGDLFIAADLDSIARYDGENWELYGMPIGTIHEEQHKNETSILEQLKNTADYSYLNQKINQFQLRFQKIQTKEHSQYVDPLIQSPLLKSIDRATNFKSKINYTQANATYNFMSGNIEEAYNFNKQFLNLLEENPHFLKIYAERYLGTLNNMLIDSLSIGNYDTLEEGLNRLIQTTKLKAFRHIKNIESRVFRQRYLLLLNWCLGQKDFEKALIWIPEIEQGLELHAKNIEKHHRITFYYLNAYLLFLNKHFDGALNWCNDILNESKEDVVKEIFYFARILNLLIHFELKNYDYLDSLLISTPKYLKSRRPLYHTEKSLIQYMSKVLKSVDKKDKLELTEQFSQELQEIIKDPKERRVFNYIDLNHWISK
jgi:hypothetical protein